MISSVRLIPALGVLAVATAAYGFIPVQEDYPMAIAALALMVLIVGFMATNAVAEFVYAGLFFALALIFQIAPADAVFSGFRSDAFWLVAGGIILGLAANKTGLGTFVAQIFLTRVGQSLPKAIIGLAMASIALAFLIPGAIARVIIMIPIVQAMADGMGFAPGSRGRRAMLLSIIIISVFIPMTILPSNFPNVLLAGLTDSLYGINITYGLYLLMNFPISGLLKAVIVVGVIHFWFRDQARRLGVNPTLRQPMSPGAKRLAVIITVTVAAWTSDVIHGVTPGWVAMTAAGICFLPGIGMIRVDEVLRQRGGFMALLTIATIVGVGAVLAASGAGQVIATILLTASDFKPNDPAYTFGAFSAINIVMMMMATLPGAIAIMVPFAGTIAETAQIPVASALMIIVNGYATVFFPYQASPMLAGLRIANVSFMDATKITFTVSLISIFTVLPLTYLWWRWLGVFG